MEGTYAILSRLHNGSVRKPVERVASTAELLPGASGIALTCCLTRSIGRDLYRRFEARLAGREAENVDCIVR